jgi:hypothetical protein
MKEIIKGNVKYVEFNQLDKRQIDRLTNGGVEMKPIIFNTLMVQAILDGRKTQTRRVINPSRKQINFMGDMDIRSLVRPDESTEEWLQLRSENGSPVTCIKVPYRPGDVLYVRETWSRDESGEYVYRTNYGTTEDDSFPPSMFKWKPSIHMPREAARIFLRVTNVRIERLQDISEDDARAEGMESEEYLEYYEWAVSVAPPGSILPTIRSAFAGLWDKLNARRGYGWDTNPWVWVIEFERITKEEAERLEGIAC